MRIHYVLAVLAAMALFFAAGTSSAQDKPNASGATKPNTGAPSTSKPSKSATQPSLQHNGVNSNAAKEGAGTKLAPPPAAQTAPAEGRGERSCHNRDSDA